MGSRDFHKSDEEHLRYLEGSITRHLESGQITNEDASLIREFLEEMRATKHISLVRARKLNAHLISWRQFIGPYRENTMADLHSGIVKLQTHKRENGEKYEQNTQRDFVVFLKRFYLWLIENEYSTIPEKKIKAIKPPATNTMTKTAESLLTVDEVRAMLDACFTSRDRALLACLFEGAFRIGELGTLTWGQVKFTEWNCTINVKYKTQKPRFVPLVFSRGYMAQWRNDYPGKADPDSPVFLTRTGVSLSYAGVSKQIRDIAERAGIKKHITPHLFRHSRVTAMIREGFNDSVIKRICWGNINTNMFSTYAHLTDSDIEQEIAEHAGIAQKNVVKRSEALDPLQCHRCYTVNPPTSSFCSTCGSALTEDVANHLQESVSEIESDPRFQVAIRKALTEMGIPVPHMPDPVS